MREGLDLARVAQVSESDQQDEKERVQRRLRDEVGEVVRNVALGFFNCGHAERVVQNCVEVAQVDDDQRIDGYVTVLCERKNDYK